MFAASISRKQSSRHLLLLSFFFCFCYWFIRLIFADLSEQSVTLLHRHTDRHHQYYAVFLERRPEKEEDYCLPFSRVISFQSICQHHSYTTSESIFIVDVGQMEGHEIARWEGDDGGDVNGRKKGISGTVCSVWLIFIALWPWRPKRMTTSTRTTSMSFLLLNHSFCGTWARCNFQESP